MQKCRSKENIRAEFRLERFKAELGGMMTNEVSQNRCKVLRDTPPRQVAKVNPRDWSLHRLGLKGQGMGYGKCEGLALRPYCDTSVEAQCYVEYSQYDGV